MKFSTFNLTTVITAISASAYTLPAYAHDGAAFHHVLIASVPITLFMFTVLLQYKRLLRCKNR